MSEVVTRLRQVAVERAVAGDGKTTPADRRAAFANHDVPEPATALVAKIARNAWKVTDEDIAAAKAGGLSDDAIFELAVCTAMGQATRQLDRALAALDEAVAKAKP